MNTLFKKELTIKLTIEYLSRFTERIAGDVHEYLKIMTTFNELLYYL